jgi:hypothetical protein
MSEKKKQDRPVVSDYDDPSKILRPLDYFEPRLKRVQLVQQALEGSLPTTECPHPISRIGQFYDDEHGGKEFVNLFECQDCHTTLWLSDPHGKDAADR